MLTFNIDPNSAADPASCSTCCCQKASAKVGETNKVTILYSAWSQPIGGRGIGQPNVALSLLTKAAPSSNLQPVVTPFYGLTALNTSLAGNLATVVSDPEAATLAYSAMPLYGPSNGQVVINANGSFTYTPGPSFTGYDRFFYTVTDNVSLAVVGEVIIGVSPALPSLPLTLPTAAMVTPPVLVRSKFTTVNVAWQSISFPLEVSPQASPGDIYRMTIRTPAYDCDGATYFHVSCYDIAIEACR